MEFLTDLVKQLGPVTAAGWGFFFYTLKQLFDEKKASEARDDAADKTTADLRDKIQQMTERHADILLAASEHRIEDLKDLIEKYDLTVSAVIKALEQK